ncbi:MAG: hypothetical protein ACRCVX_14215 [Shewanella sp.]
MAAPGAWKRHDYSADNTANYGQVGTTNDGRTTIEQTAFFRFKGYSKAYIEAANNAAEQCDVVFIHFLANGLKVVQGLEAQTVSGPPEKSAVRETKITPSLLSEVSQASSRMEYTVAGNSNTFSLSTTLTDALITAL